MTADITLHTVRCYDITLRPIGFALMERNEMNNLYKIDRSGIRKFVREDRFAVVASQNFLAAFGVYLAEEGWGHDEVLTALQKIDSIMDREDNVQRLEELAQIRLDIKG